MLESLLETMDLHSRVDEIVDLNCVFESYQELGMMTDDILIVQS
jgi:hypothetical protein